MIRRAAVTGWFGRSAPARSGTAASSGVIFSLGEDGIGQLVVLGQAGDGGQLLVQQLQTLFQVLVAVRVDRQGQGLLALECGELLGRQQVVVEVAELPRALDPDVAGAQGVLQLGQGADFVEFPVEAFRAMITSGFQRGLMKAVGASAGTLRRLSAFISRRVCTAASTPCAAGPCCSQLFARRRV